VEMGPRALVRLLGRCDARIMWIDAKGSTVLPAAECMRLLAVTAKRGGVVRLAIPTDGAPVVVPVNFTLRDRQIWIRVGRGFLSHEAAGRLVAVEADDVDATAGTAWSVLARGLATLIETPSEAERAAAGHPLVVNPGAMVLVVRPDVITGRQFEIVPRSQGLPAAHSQERGLRSDLA
jgi:hypothetical protein